MAKGRWLWTLLMVLPVAAWSDEVHLKSGGVVRGVIVERSEERVVIEAGPGRVGLPMSRVDRVVESGSALATFHGLARLARWAEDHDLATAAYQAWQQVLRLDPRHPEANAALGRVYHEGAWMNREDAYRQQGYVPFEGGWVTPEEHEAHLRERTERELAASERQEAELRVREAEARAREAEARAREAEAQADQSADSAEGIPYWWVLAGGGGYWPPVAGHRWRLADRRRGAVRPGKPERPARPPFTGGTPGRSIHGQPQGSSPRPRPRPSSPRSSGSGSIH